MNDSFLSEHGKVLSSEIALSVLFLIYEKPRKYNELRDIIYPMIRTKQRVEDGKNMHAYYLRKLKKIQAIKLKKSLGIDACLLTTLIVAVFFTNVL